MVCPVVFWSPVNTGANSWATPIAATPARPVAACRARYGRITSILRSSLPKRTTGISLASASERHRAAKRGADLLQDCRRRDRITQMRGQKARPPARPVLQIRHITIQIDPIQTLNIQHHMPIEHIVHRHRRSHLHSLTATEPPDQTPSLGGQRRSLTGGVSASLINRLLRARRPRRTFSRMDSAVAVQM